MRALRAMPRARTLVALAPFVAIAFVLMAAAECALASAPGDVADEDALKSFLIGYLHEGDAAGNPEGQTRYVAAWVDLNDSGRLDAIVYLSGTNWCGNGGCVLLVLEPSQSSFKVRARTTVTWPPIGLLQSKTHGWRDIVATVGGGGIPGHQIVLAFDGTRYPRNPTAPPAHRLTAGAMVKTIIQEDFQSQSKPLR